LDEFGECGGDAHGRREADAEFVVPAVAIRMEAVVKLVALRKLINLGAVPESVTTVGIQSKRIGAGLHGVVMAPCAACGRLLSALDIVSRGG
jgi:hypothetical protein